MSIHEGTKVKLADPSFRREEHARTAPIHYLPAYIPDADNAFQRLWNELAWLDVAGPRIEYYINDHAVPYTYGKGAGERVYQPQPAHPVVTEIRKVVEALTGATLDVCFLNGYRDGSDQLGWHADDSPEMDPARPIVIVSLGAKREIYFRAQYPGSFTEKVWLENGSVCVMPAGMQQAYYHRIPKASYAPCGPRISLTFRGYVAPTAGLEPNIKMK